MKGEVGRKPLNESEKKWAEWENRREGGGCDLLAAGGSY